ncbi:probable E3 ubiquitin-protein ligase HERC4 isoform X2 [Nilaparvata lugens]|uniref:probable E3 ubiquitin-protein ligase HERC4 isoform X2 n=1 Tax=Nilaparvata lugens TaxID=108931 RepID=UPI00193D305A|nr:probable E3 ubiquitin-protein ligase HERC4 isoform X2 [Nilaparvata lugens]
MKLKAWRRKSISPTYLPISRVSQVSCGLRHTAVLLDSGDLYMCGQGRKGQLGVIQNGAPLLESDELLHVSDLSNVKSVACGQNHTIALTGDGCIYGWGDNKHRQLGMSSVSSSAASPIKIASEVPVSTKLYAGWTHSVLLKDDGSMMCFGRNCYGQLGNGMTQDDSWMNYKVEMLPPVRQLAVGSEHNIALSETGSVLSWGWNEHGSCGLNHQDNVHHPTQVQFSNDAVLIGSGSAHSFAVLTD